MTGLSWWATTQVHAYNALNSKIYFTFLKPVYIVPILLFVWIWYLQHFNQQSAVVISIQSLWEMVWIPATHQHGSRRHCFLFLSQRRLGRCRYDLVLLYQGISAVWCLKRSDNSRMVLVTESRHIKVMSLFAHSAINSMVDPPITDGKFPSTSDTA